LVEDALILWVSSGAIVVEVVCCLLHHREHEHLLTAPLDCAMPNIPELLRPDAMGGEDIVGHFDSPSLADPLSQLL
jgi:hypothetical protein